MLTGFIAILMLIPVTASADLASIWLKGKGGMASGTGDVFETIDGKVGYGAEAGIELLGIDLWGEAVALGNDQYAFSGNLGWDLSLKLVGLRWTAGADVGIASFKLAEPENETVVIPDIDGIPQSVITSLNQDLNSQIDSQLGSTSEYAAGATARIRGSVEYGIVPMVYLGLGARYGYHFIFSGEDAEAQAKDIAIDQLVNELENGTPSVTIPPSSVALLKEAVGAKVLDPSEMSGTNYEVSLYLKFDVGI